jgi:hypothetical protein
MSVMFCHVILVNDQAVRMRIAKAPTTTCHPERSEGSILSLVSSLFHRQKDSSPATKRRDQNDITQGFLYVNSNWDTAANRCLQKNVGHF